MACQVEVSDAYYRIVSIRVNVVNNVVSTLFERRHKESWTLKTMRTATTISQMALLLFPYVVPNAYFKLPR